MPKIETTTPTTPAMPITTTHDDAEPARDALQVHADDCADLPKNAHGLLPSVSVR